jgi:membrane protease YdiL (CAAX protease family)
MIGDDPQSPSASAPPNSADEVFDAYRAPGDGITYLTADTVVAETLPPLVSRPRIWPALLVGTLTLPLAFVISTAVLLAAMLAHLDFRQFQNPVAVEQWLKAYMLTKQGILVMALPGQLTFLGVAWIAAWLSPVPFRERLRLVPGSLPLWTWPLLIFSAPGMGLLSSLLMSLFFDQASEQLQMLEDMFRSVRGPFLIVLLGLVAVLPGLGEESLFRGYVQSRLLLRMPVWAAIGISAVLFSIAHLDPMHVLAVFPFGIWLGIIAWRCGSIWPCVLGHMVNNAISIMMTHFSEAKGFEIIADAPTVALMAVSGIATVGSVVVLVLHRPASIAPVEQNG